METTEPRHHVVHHRNDVGIAITLRGGNLIPLALLIGAQAEHAIEAASAAFHFNEAPAGYRSPEVCQWSSLVQKCDH